MLNVTGFRGAALMSGVIRKESIQPRFGKDTRPTACDKTDCCLQRANANQQPATVTLSELMMPKTLKGKIMAALLTIGSFAGSGYINVKVVEHQLAPTLSEIHAVSDAIMLSDITQAVKLAAPSTVKIKTSSNKLGSGVILQGKDNRRFIVTNGHIVENENKQLDPGTTIEVRLYNGNESFKSLVLNARVLKQPDGKPAFSPSTEHDLAILEIDPESSLPDNIQPAKMRDILANPPIAGENVIAIGNPFNFTDSVTSGIVSHVDRLVGLEPQNRFIQTDAAINPGNSGGGLFSIRKEKGQLKVELLGINTLTFMGGNTIGQAIRVDYLQDFLKKQNLL